MLTLEGGLDTLEMDLGELFMGDLERLRQGWNRDPGNTRIFDDLATVLTLVGNTRQLATMNRTHLMVGGMGITPQFAEDSALHRGVPYEASVALEDFFALGRG